MLPKHKTNVELAQDLPDYEKEFPYLDWRTELNIYGEDVGRKSALYAVSTDMMNGGGCITIDNYCNVSIRPGSHSLPDGNCPRTVEELRELVRVLRMRELNAEDI